MTDRLLWLLPGICLLACFMSLWFDSQAMQKHALKTKLLASLAFVGFAWDLGATESSYGQLILAGLLLSLMGDVLLAIKGQKKCFLLGIGAFLLAHILYAVAFSTLATDKQRLMLVLPVISVAVVAVGLWLKPHLTGAFRLAVPGYLIAIGFMLMMAWLVPMNAVYYWVVTGASLFALSPLRFQMVTFLIGRTDACARINCGAIAPDPTITMSVVSLRAR